MSNWFRFLASAVWQHKIVFIRGRVIDAESAFPASREVEGAFVECLTLQSPLAIEEVRSEVPPSFRDSACDLKKRLEEGCVVIVARKKRQGAPDHEILGYLIAEKGVFSAFGRKINAGADVLYGHYYEVLPEYRQKGIGNLLIQAMEDYARKNGLRRYYALVSPKNRVARRILESRSQEWLGKAERLSILRGLYVRETPWEEIEKTLRKLGE